MLMSLVIFILSQVFSEQILGMLVSSDRIVGAATDIYAGVCMVSSSPL